MQALQACVAIIGRLYRHHAVTPTRLPFALLAVAAAVLALDPLLWLIHTWRDPSYDSNGLLAAGLVTAIAARSATSETLGSSPRSLPVAIGLLTVSALVRLVGAVNVLGASTRAASRKVWHPRPWRKRSAPLICAITEPHAKRAGARLFAAR